MVSLRSHPLRQRSLSAHSLRAPRWFGCGRPLGRTWTFESRGTVSSNHDTARSGSTNPSPHSFSPAARDRTEHPSSGLPCARRLRPVPSWVRGGFHRRVSAQCWSPRLPRAFGTGLRHSHVSSRSSLVADLIPSRWDENGREVLARVRLQRRRAADLRLGPAIPIAAFRVSCCRCSAQRKPAINALFNVLRLCDRAGAASSAHSPAPFPSTTPCRLICNSVFLGGRSSSCA